MATYKLDELVRRKLDVLQRRRLDKLLNIRFFLLPNYHVRAIAP